MPTEVRPQHPCYYLGMTLTCSDSWKDEAWYCAYLAMVVCERELSQGQICLVPVRSQFSSEGCCTWVRTSTVCSPLASTSVLVEKRPKSVRESQTECHSGKLAQLILSLPTGQASDEVDIDGAERSTKNPSPRKLSRLPSLGPPQPHSSTSGLCLSTRTLRLQSMKGKWPLQQMKDAAVELEMSLKSLNGRRERCKGIKETSNDLYIST